MSQRNCSNKDTDASMTYNEKTNTIHFIIKQPIVGKERPRFNRYTGTSYTPFKTKQFESAVKAAYLAKYPVGQWVLNKEQPISVTMDFHFKVYDSWSRKKKERMTGKYCLKRIDLDNCYKAITDALNGVAFPDDSQIVEIKSVRKVWDETEYISVCMTEIKDEEL